MHAVCIACCALLTPQCGLLCLRHFDQAIPVLLTMVWTVLLTQQPLGTAVLLQCRPLETWML